MERSHKLTQIRILFYQNTQMKFSSLILPHNFKTVCLTWGCHVKSQQNFLFCSCPITDLSGILKNKTKKNRWFINQSWILDVFLFILHFSYPVLVWEAHCYRGGAVLSAECCDTLLFLLGAHRDDLRRVESRHFIGSLLVWWVTWRFNLPRIQPQPLIT